MKSLQNVLLSRLRIKNISSDGIDDSLPTSLTDSDCETSQSFLNSSKAQPIDIKCKRETKKHNQEIESTTEFWNQVNSPETLRRYIDSDRVDTDFTITDTQRGEDLLIYQGFSYR